MFGYSNVQDGVTLHMLVVAIDQADHDTIASVGIGDDVHDRAAEWGRREGHDLVVLIHEHANHEGAIGSFLVAMPVAKFLPCHGGRGGAAPVLLASRNLERTRLNTGQ